MNDLLFVYRKGNEIKVRYRDDAIILEDSKEWEHIETLEPRTYIQHILTENPHLIEAFFSVSTD